MVCRIDYPRKLIHRASLVEVWNVRTAGINNTFVAEDWNCLV